MIPAPRGGMYSAERSLCRRQLARKLDGGKEARKRIRVRLSIGLRVVGYKGEIRFSSGRSVYLCADAGKTNARFCRRPGRSLIGTRAPGLRQAPAMNGVPAE